MYVLWIISDYLGGGGASIHPLNTPVEQKWLRNFSSDSSEHRDFSGGSSSWSGKGFGGAPVGGPGGGSPPDADEV